jgi:hypothetical protein
MIHIGYNYTDLGGHDHRPASLNLGIKTFLNGTLVQRRAQLGATHVVAAAILDVHLRDRDVTPVADALAALKIPMSFPPHLRLRHPSVIVFRKPVEVGYCSNGLRN